MSGVTRQSYTPEIRIVRLMCTGRVDLAFVFRSFLKGADGVIIGGCWPGECHYVTEGNYGALGNLHLGRKLLERIGMDPQRFRLEWIAAAEGMRFAKVMNDFANKIKELGPLERDKFKVKLEALERLVPYLKLVERERLRVPEKSEEAYQAFYTSEETGRLFDELIADKLTISQILTLLAEKPLSTGEISGALGLNPSEVARHMNVTSRQGLVRYDSKQKRYALA
jgi:F420-non-reducing hydrogenase iron-sulfur subunit